MRVLENVAAIVERVVQLSSPRPPIAAKHIIDEVVDPPSAPDVGLLIDPAAVDSQQVVPRRKSAACWCVRNHTGSRLAFAGSGVDQETSTIPFTARRGRNSPADPHRR